MNYEELLEKARETYESEDTPHVVKAWLLANIIYPADESEDERMKKEIISILKGETVYTSKEDIDKYVDWLEKQGEKNFNYEHADIPQKDFAPIEHKTLDAAERVNK